jgi:dihydropteroate synthase
MQGEPRTMQAAPRYVDVVTEVHEFLRGRLQACLAAGIETERLAIDPGFGFGKTLEHNLRLLRGLTSLATLGRPVVAGLSRKSMIAKILARDTGERLHGSLALAAIAVMNGARVVRAHDVAATVDAVRIAAAVLGDREEQ